jgi:hypothetical protein
MLAGLVAVTHVQCEVADRPSLPIRHFRIGPESGRNANTQCRREAQTGTGQTVSPASSQGPCR